MMPKGALDALRSAERRAERVAVGQGDGWRPGFSRHTVQQHALAALPEESDYLGAVPQAPSHVRVALRILRIQAPDLHVPVGPEACALNIAEGYVLDTGQVIQGRCKPAKVYRRGSATCLHSTMRAN